MGKALPVSHLVPGVGGEQLRLKPAKRNGGAVVQLDVLQPFASHSTALTVIGRPVFIPTGQVEAVCQLLARLASASVPADPPEDGL